MARKLATLVGCGVPVVIRIDGKPEVWGSPQLGLSASERSEYDELHSRHSTQDRELHDKLGSATAQITNALRRAAKALMLPPACAVRGDLTDSAIGPT